MQANFSEMWFSLLILLPHAIIPMKGVWSMDISRGIESGNWHYQLVEGVLYISAKDPSGNHVALTANETYDLLEYLYQYKDDIFQAAYNGGEQKADPGL
jgi:hypothetical protein